MRKYVLKNNSTGNYSTIDIKQQPFIEQFMDYGHIFVYKAETEQIENSSFLNFKEAIYFCVATNETVTGDYIPLVVNHIDGKYVIADNQKTIKEMNEIVEHADKFLDLIR